MMDKYNCTAPFFPFNGNQSFDDLETATALECKLNNFTKEQLVDYRDSYLGKVRLEFSFWKLIVSLNQKKQEQ